MFFGLLPVFGGFFRGGWDIRCFPLGVGWLFLGILSLDGGVFYSLGLYIQPSTYSVR